MNVLPKIIDICEFANGKLNVRWSGNINATMALRVNLSAKLCLCRRNDGPMDEELVD
jgi:hypothetical protein